MSSQPRPARPRKAVDTERDHVRPPRGEPDDDPRYAALPPEARPRGESLHDVTRRLLPYWYDAIVPDLPNATPLLYEFPAGQPGQPG